jgi:hypothetical protein
MLLGAMSLAGGVYAACVGPYCYDDVNATIEKKLITTWSAPNAISLPSATTTQIAARTPKAAGELVLCTSGCAQAGAVCISTGPSAGAWLVFNSSLSTAGIECDKGN